MNIHCYRLLVIYTDNIRLFSAIVVKEIFILFSFCKLLLHVTLTFHYTVAVLHEPLLINRVVH